MAPLTSHKSLLMINKFSLTRNREVVEMRKQRVVLFHKLREPVLLWLLLIVSWQIIAVPVLAERFYCSAHANCHPLQTFLCFLQRMRTAPVLYAVNGDHWNEILLQVIFLVNPNSIWYFYKLVYMLKMNSCLVSCFAIGNA